MKTRSDREDDIAIEGKADLASKMGLQRILRARRDSSGNVRSVFRTTCEHAELLQALGAVFLRHGQRLRGLALTYLANRLVPDDEEISVSLAYAYLANDEPDLALKTLDTGLGGGHMSPRWEVDYLRAKAMLAAGRLGEAQALFARAVAPRIGTDS